MGNIRAVNDAGVSPDRLQSRANDVKSDGVPAVLLFNNEACGLQVSLSSHERKKKKTGGKTKITVSKTRKDNDTDCPAA